MSMTHHPTSLLRPVTVFVCVLLLGALSAGASAAPGPAEPQPNAALLYWQIFDTFSHVKPDSAEGKLIDNWQNTKLDKKVADLVVESALLGGFEQAVALDHCDWGMRYLIRRDGPEAILPHVSHARRLSRLALLRARYRVEHGQSGESLEDAARVMKLGRHLAVDAVLISVLVDAAMGASARQFVADHFGQWTDADLQLLEKRMAALPARPGLGACIRLEKEGFLNYLDRTYQAVVNPKAGAKGEKPSPEPVDGIPPLIQAGLRIPETYKAMTKNLADTYEKLAVFADLPYAEGRAKTSELLDEVTQSTAVASALTKMMIPAVSSILDALARDEAQHEMLLAAIALRTGGEEAFKQRKDPFGDGPFGRRDVEGGFELSSKLPDSKGKPLTMRFKSK